MSVFQADDAGANPARAASARSHGVGVHTGLLNGRASDLNQKVAGSIPASVTMQPARIARRKRPTGRRGRRLPHTQEDVVRLHGRTFENGNTAPNALTDELPPLKRANPARFRTGPFGVTGRQRPAWFGARSSPVQVRGLRLGRSSSIAPPWPKQKGASLLTRSMRVRIPPGVSGRVRSWMLGVTGRQRPAWVGTRSSPVQVRGL